MPKNRDIIKEDSKPTPTVAQYYKEIPWQEKFLDLFPTPLGIGLAVPAALILLFILGMSLYAYASGDIVSGTGSLLAIALLGGGIYYLIRYVLRSTHGDSSTARAYSAWQQWLHANYRLDLTDDQNNQLVNGERGHATMKDDGTWGSTYISRFGRVVTVRLVGNDFDGYRLEQLKGRKYVPMRER